MASATKSPATGAGRTLSFPEWLAVRVAERSPAGDLARDAADDSGFPDLDSLGAYRDYLWSCGAVHEAVVALERARRRYATARRTPDIHRKGSPS